MSFAFNKNLFKFKTKTAVKLQTIIYLSHPKIYYKYQNIFGFGANYIIYKMFCSMCTKLNALPSIDNNETNWK